ncbi:MAG: substrate-binding domain-containing protein [Ruminococcus sp.]|jgi:LacI family transcriptional regulator
MAVTLQQIAEKAGVSRGTVDRALNNRGRIRPEVAEKIRRIAEEMGYRPNRAGKALALTNRSFRIGVILQETETPFMKEILEGIGKAKEEVEHLGGEVILKEVKGINTKAVVEAMENFLAENVQAIAINPAQNQRTSDMIQNYMTQYGIPIMTFNTDIEDSGRLCYIGQEAYQCGRAAAGLMGEILGGEGMVAAISGYETNPSLNKRCEGFRDEIQERYPRMQVCATKYAYNSNAIAENITREILEQHRDLAGIFITTGVEAGVCAALEKEGKLGKVKLIITDITPGSEKWFKSGDISFAILQNAQEQGYRPVMLLFEYLFDGKKPEKEFYYTDLTIITRYNLPPARKNN